MRNKNLGFKTLSNQSIKIAVMFLYWMRKLNCRPLQVGEYERFIFLAFTLRFDSTLHSNNSTFPKLFIPRQHRYFLVKHNPQTISDKQMEIFYLNLPVKNKTNMPADTRTFTIQPNLVVTTRL